MKADTPAYRGRFAPSPTGPLHFGSLVAALGSYLDARHHGGEWAVRIEDVDRPRTVPGAASDILRTLETFGLTWDGPVVYQSERDARYQAVLDALSRHGWAFPCGCSRRDIRAAGRRGPAGFVYPGTCRNGLPAGREARSWRFRVPAQPITLEDAACGRRRVDIAREIGDFVVRRADGLFAYHLAMTVDDADLGVTHVVRGADLLPCTAPQIALQQALRAPRPAYLHLPVALNAEGRKLSKQTHAPPVDTGTPAVELHRALEFLGQTPPQWCRRVDARETLDWAVDNWSRRRIAQRRSTTDSI